MIGVEDEQELERTRENRVRLVLRLAHASDHRQKILDVREAIVGIDEGQPLHVSIRERSYRRRLGQQTDDRDVAFGLVENVARRRIERCEARDRAIEYRHRMSVLAESLEELAHVLVHVSVARDVVPELIVLLLRRQLTVAEKPRYLQERRVLSQLLDWISAITQDSLVAI